MPKSTPLSPGHVSIPLAVLVLLLLPTLLMGTAAAADATAIPAKLPSPRSFAAAVTAPTGPAQPAGAGFELLSGQLSVGRTDHAAVASDSHVYYLGGGTYTTDHAGIDTIDRLDPATGEVVRMGGRLPTPRSYVSGVWAEGAAYVFGGCNDGSQCRRAPVSDIVRYDPATDVATIVAHFPTGRVATAAVWTGQYAYVFGGDRCGPHPQCMLDQIVRFDPATNEVLVMPTKVPGGSIAASAAWIGGKAYLFGGIAHGVTTTRVLEYDPATGAIAQVATLPTARYWTSAAALDGKAYVFGGHDGTFLASVLEFDPATRQVRVVPGAAFPTARYTAHAAVHGDAAYVSGGWDGATRQRQVLRFALTDATPGAAGVQTVYVLGGHRGNVEHADILAFDPATQTLRPTGALLPTPRHAHAAALGADGSIYVFGGSSGGATLDAIVRYTPQTGEVTTLATRLPQVMAVPSAVAAGDGKIYLLGGLRPGGTAVDTILRFDPATQALDTLPAKLPTPRERALGGWDPVNAKVYLVGGVNGQTFLRDVVEFDPATGSVRVAAYLPHSGTSAPGGGLFEAAGGISVADRAFYVLGGYSGSYCQYAWQNKIQRFNLDTKVTDVVGAMPFGRSRHSAAVTNDAIYSFGGHNCGNDYDQILRMPITPAPTAPGAPRNLQASAGPGAGEATLAWDAPADGAAVAKYRVYRASSPREMIAEVAGATTYVDAGLTPGATYAYDVTAVSAADVEGPSSGTVTFTAAGVPGAPQVLFASSGPRVGEIRLDWAQPASDGGAPVTRYNVYRKDSPMTPMTLVASVDGATLRYSDLGRAPIAWTYVVRAANAIGEGPESPEAVARPPGLWIPDPPEAGKASSPTLVRATSDVWDAEVSLRWTSTPESPLSWRKVPMAPDGNGGYAASIPKLLIGSTAWFYVSADAYDTPAQALRIYADVLKVAVVPVGFSDDCRVPSEGRNTLDELEAWLAGEELEMNQYMWETWGSGRSLGFDFHTLVDETSTTGWFANPRTCSTYETWSQNEVGNAVGNFGVDVYDRQARFVLDALLKVPDDVYHTAFIVTPGPSGFDGRAVNFNGDDLFAPGVERAILVNEFHGLGTWLHELGHSTGLGDYYFERHPNKLYPPSYNANEGVLQTWDLMATGECIELPGVGESSGVWPAPYSMVTRTAVGWMQRNAHGFGYDGQVTATTTELAYHGNDATIVGGGDGEFFVERRLARIASGQEGVVLYLTQDGRTDALLGGGNRLPEGECPYPIRPTLTEAQPVYADAMQNVKFTLQPGSGNRIVDVDSHFKPRSWGWRLFPVFPTPVFLPSFAPDGTAASVDLHAVTADGRHVGMDYATGTYEIGIPGAETSGPRDSTEEWILLPEGIDARFYVTSADPSLLVNATVELQRVAFDENPYLTATPEGEVVVVGRMLDARVEVPLGSDGLLESLDSTAPEVALAAPTPGALHARGQAHALPDARMTVVVGSATLAIDVAEPESAVTAVELWRDGALVASYDGATRAIPLGAATLVPGCQVVEAKAVNAFGLAGSASLEILYVGPGAGASAADCSWSAGEPAPPAATPCFPHGGASCASFTPLARLGDLVASAEGAPLSRGALAAGGASAPFPSWDGLAADALDGAAAFAPGEAACAGDACAFALVPRAAPDARAAELWLGVARVHHEGADVASLVVARPMDRQAPALATPGDLTPEATGPDGARVTYEASATDLLDGTLAPACAPAPGSRFALDEAVTASCAVVDSEGLAASASFLVTVRDTTPPALTVPEDVLATATGTAGATVTYAAPSAADLVDGAVAASCAPASGATFAPGDTLVTCTASDARGNAATATFVVRVRYDATPLGAPVAEDGSATFRAGSAVPLKFALSNASAGVADLQARALVAPADAPGEAQPAAPSGRSSEENLFRYDADEDQYVFAWSTRGLAPGAYDVLLDLGDGVARSVRVTLR